MRIPATEPRTPIRLLSPHADNTPRPADQAIVLHATCGSERPRAARNVARMFADRNLRPRRSAHLVIDSVDTYECVLPGARAWHCGHTGNLRTYGIEICGLATQSMTEWGDMFSMAALSEAAAQVRRIAELFKIPLDLISAAELRALRRGITSHYSVGVAWRETDHTDPGLGFPWRDFMACVKGNP